MKERKYIVISINRGGGGGGGGVLVASRKS